MAVVDVVVSTRWCRRGGCRRGGVDVAVVDVAAVVVVPHLAGFVMRNEEGGGLLTWRCHVKRGGGGNEVGWWWWWEESDKWAVVEPRLPIWPLAGRDVRRSHLTFIINRTTWSMPHNDIFMYRVAILCFPTFEHVDKVR